MTFDEIDARRRALELPVYRLCKLSGVAYSTYHRIARGTPRPYASTLRRLASGLDVAPPRGAGPASDIDLINSVFRAWSAHFAEILGVDAEEALASRPQARANGSDEWREAARVRELAVYCTSTELGIRGAVMARAIGVTRQAVSIMLKRVEETRDDPSVDQMLEKVGRMITGRAT